MKKQVLWSISVWCILSVSTVCLMTSCGGEDTSGPSNEIVSEAEAAVPETASPCLGNIPALQMQYSEAVALLKEKTKQRYEEAEQKYKDGGSKEDAERQMKNISDEKKVMEQELKQLYTTRIMAEAKKLEGKTIECEADGVQYSAAAAKFVCAKDSSITAPLTIEATLTLKKPFRGPVAYCSWKYLDSHDKEVSSGAMSLKKWKKLKAGDTLTQTFPVGVVKSDGTIFARLYFKE